MSFVMIQNDKQLRRYRPISPNLWQGEVDCVIGPFSGKDVAEYFVGHMVEFSQLGGAEEIIFPQRDAWYIEARALPDKEVVLPNPRRGEAQSGRSS
jgi:hypothetical protein